MPKQTKESSPFDALRIARLSREAESAVQPSSQLDSQTAKQVEHDAALRANMSKSTDPEFMKFTTYIRKKTHRAVKTRLVSEGRELSDLVEELMSKWLQGR